MAQHAYGPYESSESVPREVPRLQEFRDQYVAKKKVCDELGILFGRCKEETKAILTKKGVTKPTKEQLTKALDKIKQDHFYVQG